MSSNNIGHLSVRSSPENSPQASQGNNQIGKNSDLEENASKNNKTVRSKISKSFSGISDEMSP